MQKDQKGGPQGQFLIMAKVTESPVASTKSPQSNEICPTRVQSLEMNIIMLQNKTEQVQLTKQPGSMLHNVPLALSSGLIVCSLYQIFPRGLYFIVAFWLKLSNFDIHIFRSKYLLPHSPCWKHFEKLYYRLKLSKCRRLPAGSFSKYCVQWIYPESLYNGFQINVKIL